MAWIDDDERQAGVLCWGRARAGRGAVRLSWHGTRVRILLLCGLPLRVLLLWVLLPGLVLFGLLLPGMVLLCVLLRAAALTS